MFGFKSILQLTSGSVSLASLPPSLIGGKGTKFELSDFSYEIIQETDGVGKPQGEVRAGRLNLTFSNLPTTEMLEWMLHSRKYKNGEVVLYDMEDAPMQKVVFENAACVGMSVRYCETGEDYCTTNLTIVAKALQVGEVKMENDWKNC